MQAGSHAAGIFGRAATDFEQIVRAELARLLHACGVNYEKIKSSMKGAALEHATLGQLIAGVERLAELRRAGVESHLQPVGGVTSFVSEVRAINQDWVQMKHRHEIGLATILERMRSMRVIWERLAV